MRPIAFVDPGRLSVLIRPDLPEPDFWPASTRGRLGDINPCLVVTRPRLSHGFRRSPAVATIVITDGSAPKIATAPSSMKALAIALLPTLFSFSMSARPRTKHVGDRSAHELSYALAEAGRSFYSHGWVLGTSGNFSAVLQREPVLLLITASGIDKSSLNAQQFLEIDGACNVLRGPSNRRQKRSSSRRSPRARCGCDSSHALGVGHSSVRLSRC